MHHRSLFALLPLLVVLFFNGAPPSDGFAAPIPPTTCNPSWRFAEAPTPAAGWYSTYSMSALSASDIWAVGANDGGTGESPVMMHWDGNSWALVSIPTVPNTNGSLYGVSALAANDIWAAGYYFTSDSVAHLLIMHFDGSNWTVLQNLPNQGLGYLLSMAASGPNNVWAAGVYIDPSTQLERTFTLHWDGSQWAWVPSPNPITSRGLKSGTPQTGKPGWMIGSELWSITTTGLNNAWAVGAYMNGGQWQTLTERWDGSQWSIVPSPNPGPNNNHLKGIAAISSTDAWAVGYYDVDPGNRHPLALHWNGTAWSAVSLPDAQLMTYYQELPVGVAMSSDGEAWLVSTTDGPPAQPLILHWDGANWQEVPVNVLPIDTGALFSVTALSPTDVWTMGTIPYRAPGPTMGLHYTDACPATGSSLYAVSP